MNVPLPLQPVPPVKVQVPEIVLPVTAPDSVSVLPDGVPDLIVKPNVPVVWPLKLPANVNDPDSVSPDTKHGELVLKLKFVMFNDPSLLSCSDVPNVKTGDPLVALVSVAFHVPLTLDAFVLLEPHPTRVSTIKTNSAIVNCFIRIPPGLKCEGARQFDADSGASGGSTALKR